MNAAEIIVREMQGDSGFEMRQLLAERIRQARETPKLHPHGLVLPLYEARRDVFGIGITHSDLGYNPRDAWWGVPRIRAVELPIVPEHFGELREVGIQTK